MTEFNRTEIEAIELLADDYVMAGGLGLNSPGDSFGVMFVTSIRDKARALLESVMVGPVTAQPDFDGRTYVREPDHPPA